MSLGRDDPTARSSLRACAAGDRSIAVYHWTPLTSGSTFFALWPLLLPFTVLNVAGWMLPGRRSSGKARPPRRVGLVDIARVSIALLGYLLTMQVLVWLVIAADVLLFAPEDLHVGWLWGSYDQTVQAIALILAALGVAVIIAVATYTARGYERVTPKNVASIPRRRVRLTGPQFPTIASPSFFDDGHDHTVRWRWHTAIAALALAGLAVIVLRPADRLDSIDRLGNVIVVLSIAEAALLVIVAALACRFHKTAWRGCPAAATAAVAVMLVPGLTVSALVALVGLEDMPPGTLVMTFDAFGWALVVAIASSAGAIAFRIIRRPGPTPVDGTAMLGSSRARLIAAAARLPRHLNVVLTLTALTYGGAALIALTTRWDERRTWRLTATGPVTLARFAFVGLIGFVGLNVIKTYRNPKSLRRIGTIWDVATFWPRTFHPFSVRPYAERAVPELQNLLVGTRERTVVLAHSQGSVLVYAAALPTLVDRLSTHPTDTTVAPPLRNLRIVSVGCPLSSLYVKAFAGQVTQRHIDLINELRTGPDPCDRWWTNAFRLTDHVGRELFCVDADPDEYLPGDIPLCDPSLDGSAVDGHNNYWADERVRTLIERAKGEP